MKQISQFLLLVLVVITSIANQTSFAFSGKVLYKSNDLTITQLSQNTFVHTSFLQTNDFGNVPCNGLIIRNANEAVVFDTPTNDKSAEELIRWITDTLHANIIGVVPTHFHNDCLGSLHVFHGKEIPSYAYFTTIELATENKSIAPQRSFTDSLILKIGNELAMIKFFGEGHTRDNVVVYFPSEHILFGGCLIKEIGASKGYLGDANVAAWSATVEKIKKAYPNVKIIVPGHGKYGNKKLLDYTIRLFRVQ